MQEQRPLYRVATAGLDPRDVRLIEIIFRHSQYNRYSYVLDARIDVDITDLLIVDPSNPDGVRALAAVGALHRGLPVIEVVHGDDAPAHDHQIPLARLTLELLGALNRAVQEELLNPETQPLTGPHPALMYEPLPVPPPEPPVENGAVLASAHWPVPVEHENEASSFASLPMGAEDNREVLQPDPLPKPAHLAVRVLVVDDSAAVRQQLAIALTTRAIECEAAATGAQALERLRRQRFDAVLVDVVLPDTDGFKLTRQIRQLRSELPVVILSSRSSPLDRLRGMLAGSKAYLSKPVPMKDLESALGRVLKRNLPAPSVATASHRIRPVGVAAPS